MLGVSFFVSFVSFYDVICRCVVGGCLWGFLLVVWSPYTQFVSYVSYVVFVEWSLQTLSDIH